MYLGWYCPRVHDTHTLNESGYVNGTFGSNLGEKYLLQDQVYSICLPDAHRDEPQAQSHSNNDSEVHSYKWDQHIQPD